jgi:hypothetical protein
MLRRALTASLVPLLLFGAPAHADASSTSTTVEKGVVDTYVGVLPTCEQDGPLYSITNTSTIVTHETAMPDGGTALAVTTTGTWVAEPVEDPSLPTYEGHTTVEFNFHLNGQVVVGTSTNNHLGTGSDGSVFRTHTVEHFTELPDGRLLAFQHPC